MNGNVKMTQRLLECGASEPYHRLTRQERTTKMRKLAARQGVPAVQVPAEDAPSVEEVVSETIEDDDESVNEDRAQERKFNMLKNTPLHWAIMKGHLSVVWLLVVDGYSPNDLDDLDNNGVHLAAAGGYVKVLRVCVDDGGSIWSRNVYHNYPIHLSNTREEIALLQEAEEVTPVPCSDKEIAAMHEKNVQKVMYSSCGTKICV